MLRSVSVLGSIRSRGVKFLANSCQEAGFVGIRVGKSRRRRRFPREKVSTMAPGQQAPEIILAQRLASNDKPIRTKALKTLKKYISLRSQNVEGNI